MRIVASGVCQTDAFTLSGADPEGLFPAILGHEGAGIVEEIGRGVTSVAPGDHVIPLYVPECGTCEACLSMRTNLCVRVRGTQKRGLMPDGKSRFSLKDKPILHYMGTSTFSEHVVLPEIAVAKKDKGEALRQCLTKLSAEHREVIDLVYYHEKSVDEVAAIVGVPEATVKTRMFYARKKLSELLKERGIDRGWP